MFDTATIAEGEPRILGIGGTLRERSRSLAALAAGLEAAKEAGAETELLALNELRLPMFRPGTSPEDYPESVGRLLEAVQRSDGILLSTAGYHGTLAGVTKNALDFIEFLAEENYLDGRPVGMIATSGGDMAGVNAIDALVHATHALRGMALSLKVPIGGARRAIGADGEILDDKVRRRLSMLGRLVVEESRVRQRADRVRV